MALSIVQAKAMTILTFTNTSLTFAFDTTPTNGNLILLFAGNQQSDSTLDASTVTGFTKVAGENGASFQAGAAFFRKWAGASESNSYPVPDTDWFGGVIGVEISGGVGSGDPADIAVAEIVGGFTAPVLPSVTTVTDHCFVFGFVIQTDSDPDNLAATPPAGWTLIATAAANGDRGPALFYMDKSPAGATGAATITGGNGFPSVTYTYAVKPSGGGGGAAASLPLPPVFNNNYLIGR